MKTFLEDLATNIAGRQARLEEQTIVFPNRRAMLYFQKHLSSLLHRPSFSPKLLTIEEFIGSFSALRVPEKLSLIHKLYTVYQQVLRNSSDNDSQGTDGFDRFYYWGEMLIRDFDEIDKYMVDAAMLFRDLSHQKELDAAFDYLTEEQKEFLKSFWGSFDETESVNKKKFLKLWRKLPHVYEAFTNALVSAGEAYEGLLHRRVANEAQSRSLRYDRSISHLHFAGFNALTSAEEKIICHFVERGAEVHWDIDEYYVNNITQEAGRFFREYQDHAVLKKTFPSHIPANLNEKILGVSGDPKVKIYGAAQPIGQVKLMTQLIHKAVGAGMKPEETLVVLPDEKLLLPVLHGLGSSIEKINVTMGFPLSHTPMFNLVELLIDLQIQRKGDHFNHRQVLALLGHPYFVTADPASAQAKRKEILRYNWVHIPKSYLGAEVSLHRTVFREVTELKDQPFLLTVLYYLRDIVVEIGNLQTMSSLDKEYVFQFYTLLNQLEGIFINEQGASEPMTHARMVRELKSFIRLFRQLIRSYKIPFAGEPLRGMQVMGVLETRNLDFKNVYISSLNEGSLPGNAQKASYIPHAIRKAYQLPTHEHQDAMYAYLFYRVLQRAENINIFYNSETDVLGQGEMSRYLQQLLFESRMPVQKKVLHNSIAPRGVDVISINKSHQVMEALMKVNEGNQFFKGISPSALNTFIECGLKFYFRYVAKIKEADEVEEELDARVLGNFLHDVMERFYKSITTLKKSKLIEAQDYHGYELGIAKLIDQVFIETYRLDPSKPVVYEGQRLVVKEVVQRFAFRIIEIDKLYAPFFIEGLEQEGLTFSVRLDKEPFNAVVSGKIDRVDRKDNVIRVIDYKTGKDKLNFQDIPSLFSRSGDRNKAAFQTLLYALLYQRSFLLNDGNAVRLQPGLINRLNLFEDGFIFGLQHGKDRLSDVTGLLPEFELHLKNLLEDMFDPNIPFEQTAVIENCKLCPYRSICYR